MFNKVLDPKEIEKLANHILSSMEGEVYIPSDKTILSLITSDPIKDSIGVWRVLMESEYNGTQLIKLKNEEENKHLFSMFIFLKIISLLKFDLFFGSCLNPLS
jgi:hypothetical protein